MRRSAVNAALSALPGACALVPVFAAQPVMPTPPAQADYMLHCMGCHLADGSGAPGKVPSLRDSLVPLALSAAGRRYVVQVPGVSQSALSDEGVARLLGWMVRNLSTRSVPAEFADFTAAEVAGYRRSPLVNVRETRAQLLAAAAKQPPL
jgi:mono/diheme cytochrome c family protein